MKNKQTYRFLPILVLASCMSLQLGAQKVWIPDKPFEEFRLTTDRELYITGETLWFTTHCIKPTADEVIPLSKVIYAELFDASKKVIARGKFVFEHGCSSGQLVIPEEQPTGVYFLRTYTQYLKNFHPGAWPMKAVTIINPNIPLTKPVMEEQPIQCYPSGGLLAEGVRSGLAIAVEGIYKQQVTAISLLQGDSAIIRDIDYFPNGLGYFEFIPHAPGNYFLQARLKSGDSILCPLPAIKGGGTRMVIKEEKGSVKCVIQDNVSSILAQANRYYLTVSSSRFATLYQDSISAASPVKEFLVKDELLAPGINYFLVEDNAGQVISLAMHYHFRKDAVPVGLLPDKPQYRPRDQVALGIEFQLTDNETISHASIAAVKSGTVAMNPGFLPPLVIAGPYFLEAGLVPSPELQLQVKALMILYERQVKNNQELMAELGNNRKVLTHIPEIRNISISGYVREKNSGEPIQDTRVFLSYVGGPSQIQISETQPDGSFIFPVIPYRTSQDFFLCTFDMSPDQQILINSDYSTEFPVIREVAPDIDTSDRHLLEELYINYQVSAQRRGVADDNSDSLRVRALGFGTPEISIRLMDYIDLPSMEVVLNEIVPYVKVRKRKGDYRISILDSETGLTYENLLVMVDNIPIDDINELMAIYPGNVEKIDVINHTYVIGDHKFQGIIMVWTNTENFGGISLPDDAVFIDYPMITDESRFTPVDPGPGDNRSFQRADLRNVLYWNPDIDLTKDRTITFPVSDHRSDYEVFIRGVTSKGRPVTGHTTIKVNDP